MFPPDVPSPINLCNMRDAREWEKTAMDRPFRLEFFDAFAKELNQIKKSPLHVLELGSGPGFLASYLLNKFPQIQLTLLDFSSAMHELARNRLGLNNRAHYIERSFKETGWENNLGKFDAVITNQAVHELRHKRYATNLHAQVKNLLNEQAVYLFCDHYYGEGGMKNEQLYMSREEQISSLTSVGYSVKEILVKGGRALYSAY